MWFIVLWYHAAKSESKHVSSNAQHSFAPFVIILQKWIHDVMANKIAMDKPEK